MEIPEFLTKTDWNELRNQKAKLLLLRSTLNQNNIDAIDGVVNLIDAIQDYAVDEMKLPEDEVFNFNEDNIKNESPEETFAKENAETIFDMHVNGTYLYDNEIMTEDFIKSIVENKHHINLIKERIKKDIYNAVREFPSIFDHDENGKFIYDSSMYDFGYAIEDYCQEIWDSTHTKQVYVCDICGSDNVQEQRWVDLNSNEIVELGDDIYCNDCRNTVTVNYRNIYLNQQLIGFTVVNVANINEIHPTLLENGVYNLFDMNALLISEFRSWKLKSIWTGDIENPKIMYKDRPRK